jgi:GAF domain-containing protein
MTKSSSKKTITDSTEIFSPLVKAIHHVTSLPISIWVPDKDRKKIRIAASVGVPESYTRTAFITLDEKSFTGDAFKTKKIQKAIDIPSDPRWKYKKQAKEMNWKSAICVPIESDGVVIGVITVYAYTEHSISDLARILPDFAKQICLTLEVSKQKEILQRLLDISLKLQSTAESPKDVFNEIVKSACELIDASCAVVYPFDAERASFYDIENVASYGLKSELNLSEKPRGKGGMATYVKKKGEVFIDDVEKQDPSMFSASSFIQREGIRAFMGIALEVADDVLGVLYVNFRTPHIFTRSEKDTIRLLARQASTVANNTRLYWESLKRSERLELVRNVAAAVSSATDVKTILQLAVNGLAKVFDVKQSAVSLFDEAGEFANVLVEYLEPGCISALKHRIPLKNNPQIDRIIETKQPLIIDDVQNDPIMAKTRNVMTECKILSLMVVPIIIGDWVVGVIGINAVEKKRHFTSEEAELAQAIATQAAVAIQIARHIQEIERNLEKRIKDITSLREITEQMHRGEFGMVLKLIAERAVELTGANYGGIWLLDKAGALLEIGGVAGDDRPLSEFPRLPIDEHSFNGWVMQTRQPHLCNDTKNKKDVHYREWYTDTRSELAVPLFYRDRVIGTLDVESTVVDNFTSDHQQLLEAMAGQAAVVMQNARLLERLNVLDDIGLKLTSEVHLKAEEIFESIYSQVVQLTGVQDMYIALFDEGSGEIRFPLATKEGKRVEYPPRKADMNKRGKTEEIIFTRKPILHETKKEAKEWYEQPGHEEKVGLLYPSWLGVPMMVGERVLGVIAIYDLAQEHAYDEQDLQVLSSMGSQAAFALVNQELNRRNAALASLKDIGNTLTSGIRLREEGILTLIFTQTQKLTGAQDLYIALYDESSGEIRFPIATEKGEPIIYPSRKANMEKRGKTEEIIFTRKPILHKTMIEAKEWYLQVGHGELIGHISPSWLGVPMMVGERILGVIAAVDLEREYAFDELELEALSSMASQAAIALDNARLYQEARSEAVAAKQLATLGTAIAALQHRINNTLNIIIPNITRLRSRIDVTDPTIKEILEIIERNTRYTSNILTRIQMPLQEVDLVDVNINALLSDIFYDVKKGWKSDSIQSLVTSNLILDESISLTRVPVGQISEVIQNLIDNAYRAMRKGGELTVTSKLDGNSILIRVKDTAEGGIPLSIRDRLFLKPVPSKEQGQGTGLGLWLSRLMLQGIGGNVTIEETGATGTTMLLQIPVTKTKDVTN